MLHAAMLVLALALAYSSAASAGELVKVVASIAPVHALVSAVMEGAGRPQLLVPPGASPHGYQMRPSEAKALRDADLIVWVGPELESFLARSISNLAENAATVELTRTAGIELLNARAGGFEPHRMVHEHDAASHRADGGRASANGVDGDTHDPHLWLSPANAKVIGHAVASALSRMDPDRSRLYRNNADLLDAKISALEVELKALLAPVRDRPFVVAHDAYQYLERAFGLAAAGSITATQDRPPSAARVAALRDRLRSQNIVCVMAEARGGNAGIVARVTDGTGATVGELDAEGTFQVVPGPEIWFTLMRRNAEALRECLSHDGR